MGVNHTTKCLHSITLLERGDIPNIIHGMAHKQGMDTPTMVVNCNNVCFKLGKQVQGLTNFLMMWARAGLCVVPICDGKQRPISKQATNK